MGVIQDTDTVVYLFLHQIPHTLSKRAGIADGGSLTDTGGKGDGVRPLTHQRAGPQHCLFPRAAAAVDKAHKILDIKFLHFQLKSLLTIFEMEFY